MTPKKKGRPRHSVTDQNKSLVKFAKIAGVTNEQLCELLNISSVNTLKKYYKTELDLSEGVLNAQIAGKLYQEAISGNTSCLIFWAKARMGWSDKGFEKADKEIVVTVKRSKKQHNADEIEKALLDESES